MNVTTLTTPKPDVVITLTNEEAKRLRSALDTNFQWCPLANDTLSGEDESWATSTRPSAR